MSKPGTIYRLIHQPFENVLQYIDIADTDNQIDDGNQETIIPIIGAGTPWQLSVIDNSEDPFTVVKAQQATIRFLSASNVTMSTFASGSDQRWAVHSYLDNLPTRTLFKGFLVLSDMSEDWMPLPNIVTLTANDGLGLLKDIPLTDFDGLNPTGYNRIADYIAWCLSKTGLDLVLNAAFNIRRRPKVFVTTLSTTFVVSPNQFITEVVDFFYPGQIIVITGTVSNNGTFTVTAVGTGIVAIVQVAEPLTAEVVATPVTFTDQASGHFFDTVYLNAKTFEDKIGTCINCYRVLEIILGEEAVLFQRQGKWCIVRVDEIEHPTRGLYVTTFTALGVFDAVLGEIHYDKQEGKDSPYTIFFSREQTQITLDRPHKSVKLTYNYELPLEVVCNIDFSRGDFIADLPDEVVDGETLSVKSYQVECWTLKRLFAQPITSTIFIKRLFLNDYEKERYLTITPASSSASPWDFAESEGTEVGIKDKITVSVDFKFASDIGSGGAVSHHPLRIFLIDEAGQWWFYWHPSSTNPADFYWTGPEVSADFERTIPDNWILSDVDETEWRSFSIAMKPLPATGKLYIGLNQMNQTASAGDNVNVYYQNLQVEILAYINGSYQRYIGQSQEVTQAGDYKAKREEQVYISDSPRKIFKGALIEKHGDNYVLAGMFYNDAVTPSPPSHPYGEIQVFDVWNQFRNDMRIFQATLQGLDLAVIVSLLPDSAHLIHKWAFTDLTEHTNDRFFFLLTFNQDFRTGEWTGVFREVYNLVREKAYLNRTFKYIT